jgi:type I restriction enzyme M protein
MHMLHWLSAQGTAAIIEFPWVLYRWWAEQKIRKYLIDNNFVDTVIQLPADLFFWVTIATCIIVLKKNKKDTNITFIDATNEFIRSWNKNKLTEEHQQRILDSFIHKENIDHFAYIASYDEVKWNDYNLSVSTYVEAENTKEEIDIDELNKKIAEIVEKENRLRAEIDKIIKENF